jgi:tRNA pseudouridine55 synthase
VGDERRGPDGLVVVDKAVGWTSHDVVAKLRGVLGTRKVGHSGTLDPDATGVLLVGVGRVTRLLRFLTVLPKTYAGEVVLGAETSTLDAAGTVTATHDMSHVTLVDVRAVLPRFRGDILQIPPMVSAVRVGGRRLHEIARAGEEIERDARPVTVHRLEAEATAEPGVFRIDVDCSSGTYVRSLAADIGAALGGGAHLRNLRRLAVGPFPVDEAAPIESVTLESVVPPPEALRGMPSVTVDAVRRVDVGHGKVLAREDLGVAGAYDGPWAVLDEDGTLLGVYEAVPGGDRCKPAVVMI